MWCENLDLVLLPTRQARTQKMPWLLPEILNLIYEASMAKLQGQFHKDIIIGWNRFWRKILFLILLDFLSMILYSVSFTDDINSRYVLNTRISDWTQISRTTQVFNQTFNENSNSYLYLTMVLDSAATILILSLLEKKHHN